MGSLSKVQSPSRMSIAFLLAAICLTLIGPTVETADAGHFGFRGGFRGGFGRSFKGVGKFNSRRFGSFRRFGFRGFRGFGRSRFNSLAFRSRRFGFGGFNKFKKVNNFGFGFGRTRFNTFQPKFNTFAFNHFPVQRIHSGFGTFHHPNTFVANRFTSGPNHFTSVRLPSHICSGNGWDHLANGQNVQAQTAFIDDIAAGGSPGIARVGFALASADAGDLDKGVWAMRRAFEADKDMAASLMMDDTMSELVSRVTRLYETRMEEKGTNSEDAFMLAAMYQLQGDPEMAMMAVDYAVEANDGKLSTTNLSQLIESEMASIPMDNSVAWELLAAGNNDQAVETFIEEILRDETAGVPKLGYALAVAASGNLERGTWALRRAFKIDPEGTSDAMLSGKLRPVVENVTEMYVSNAEEQGINKDNSFALATLFMLQGDIEAAEMIAKNSPEDEPTYVASMIDDEMKMQMKMVSEAKDKMEVSEENSYDELVSVEEGSGTKVDPAGSGTKELAGSGTKEAPSQGSVRKVQIPEGSSSKDLVDDGSDQPILGAANESLAPEGSSTKNPVEGGSGAKEVLPGSGTKVPTVEEPGTDF